MIGDKALLAEVLAQIGVAYFGQNNHQKALAQFKEAMQLSQGSPLIELIYLHELAKYQIEANKTNERLAELVQQFPTNPRCHYEYAYSFFHLDNFTSALASLLKIQDQKFINSAVYQEFLGDIYFKLGREQEGIACWQKALNYGEGSALLSEKLTKKSYVQIP